jgi:1,4-dihydroxy-2-naphthoyl-CoA synthase
MPVEFEDITYSTAGGIACITINRPERRNALRIQTYEGSWRMPSS